MSDPYEGYNNIANSTIKERIGYFQKTCEDYLAGRLYEGATVKGLLKQLDAANDSGQYEFSEGILRAVDKFKKNPQLKLPI